MWSSKALKAEGAFSGNSAELQFTVAVYMFEEQQ